MQSSQVRASRRWHWLAVAPLLLALLCSVSYRVTDPDALSRLSLGRYLWQHLAIPATDPFTFALPDAPWSDPEWLGDLIWYGVFSQTSEGVLQLVVVAIACVGYLLSLGLSASLGASPAVAVTLLSCTLATAAPRISARNDVHLLWLVPTFAWLARYAVRSKRGWIAVGLLAWLWAQLHSSFALSAILLAAVLAEQPRSSPRSLWFVLGAIPLLPFLGLSGAATYRQLFDHLLGAPVYRAWLSEWMSPLTSGGWLAILPLHIITLLGVISMLMTRAQVRLLPLTLFGLGVLLAYSSRRFLPMMVCAIIPGMSPALTAVIARLPHKAKLATAACGVAVALAFAAVSVRSARHRSVNAVFARSSSPESAARFLAQHAPQDSRLFNAFDDGPWLLWFGRPDLAHYIDPRNNLGASFLDRYAHEILPQPAAFDAEAQRLNIHLALVPGEGRWTGTLAEHLGSSPSWTLIYWDGWYRVYARVVKPNEALLERYRYRVLRPTLDLRYLYAKPIDRSLLERDLSQLEQQSPRMADMIRAYMTLREAKANTPGARRAAAQIAQAWPTLSDTDAFARALGEISVPH